MSVIAPIADATTMLGRVMRRARRYPSLTLSTVGMPTLFLLLFVGVFGDTLGAGLASGRTQGQDYVDYVTPGILVMTVASGCLATSMTICMDMTGGIINRFRAMDIARSSPLTGHVVGNVILTMGSVAVVLGVALALGFSPSAGAGEWLLAASMLTLLTVALTWVAAILGLLAKTPEGASNSPLLISLLPFLSSAFVPTDSMPGAVGWFAEHQPFTPINETLRELLVGTPATHGPWLAIAWSAGIAVVCWLIAVRLYDRPRV